MKYAETHLSITTIQGRFRSLPSDMMLMYLRVPQAHRLLSNWTPPLNPVSALELLDVQYADYEVREYAVNCLRVLPDDELQLFLLQLTQIIKNEP